ncbi:MAG: DUF262 domain-containing protein [Deltaproteobacteria bacterium]|nr:DUF262 domain-containing protein [Deltaproteobacteria bacterium]
MTEPTENISLDARLDYERQTAKPSDIEFERIKSEEEDYESSPPNYEINTYPADFTLEVLHQKWKDKEIEIPRFQRQFVWKQVQASKLIESFLIGLPVPSVFLYTERRSQKLLVIDGQQRLRSIFYFLEGFFGEEKNGTRTIFQLKGLSNQSKYLGMSFKDLEEAEQRRLRNCVLRSFIVQQLDPNDDTSIYHIFERLNTGGTLLGNQEIRNCVYRGAFNELLHELNTFPAWRSIVGKPDPDSRQKDVELILRFFALLDRSHYQRPLKDFLSKFMKANRDPDKRVIEGFRKLFSMTSAAVVNHLGERPFHIRAGLNSAVFDCVMVSFANNLDAIPQDIKYRYERLLDDSGFLKDVSGSTTNEEVVKSRFQVAEEKLFQK